jgi:RimJ/RimL family protein N-acetyltransferase
MSLLLFNQSTERLNFRQVLPEDAAAWLPFFERPENAVFLGLDPSKSQKMLCEEFMAKAFLRYQNNLGGMNALIDKKSGNLIGQCGLLIQEWEGITFTEVGYAILPIYWQKGFATEAARKCMDYYFKKNLSNRLNSIVNIGNVGSEKVAIKNGMQIVKEIPNYQGSHVNLWEIDKTEWLKIKG